VALPIIRVVNETGRALVFDKTFSLDVYGLESSAGMRESEELMSSLNIRTSRLGTPDGHSDRVATYALAIGKRLDLSLPQLQTLKLAAILHDIGKVGISRAIVEKLGTLTAREFEIMRLHSTIAVGMLENVDGLTDCIPLVKHHHERYDGKGYPDGLSGTDIPLGARIIAVAETFDILISDVPWRRALSKRDAERELMDCSGTQFDPTVIDVFLNLLDSKQIEVPVCETEVASSISESKIN
jgi:HD-GYP domain-containing protein (c-di-GMP phosphodiesterase class II)